MRGKASQTPVMPQQAASRKAMGRIRRKPRSREVIWAGRARSTEVKYMDRMMLNPAKSAPVK